MIRRMTNQQATDGHRPVVRFNDKVKTSPLSTKNRETPAGPFAGNKSAFATAACRPGRSRNGVVQRLTPPGFACAESTVEAFKPNLFAGSAGGFPHASGYGSSLP